MRCSRSTTCRRLLAVTQGQRVRLALRLVAWFSPCTRQMLVPRTGKLWHGWPSLHCRPQRRLVDFAPGHVLAICKGSYFTR